MSQLPHPRLRREGKTIEKMISLYCSEQHAATDGALCEACENLRAYAMLRLQKCPFQERKSTCARCPVHCYKPAMRQQVRQIMRYAGPRMLRRHPVLAVLHLLDGLRKPPAVARKAINRKPSEEPNGD